MTHSESLASLAPALVAAQAEMEHAHKNAANPHFRSTYANLAEVIDTVRPVLERHGLAVVQIPGFTEGVVTLDTMLVHKSGEWIRGTSGAPAQKMDPQGVGSAVTYLRRYSLAALCGISQDDDDGEGASGRGQNGNGKQQSPPKPAAPRQQAPRSEPPRQQASKPEAPKNVGGDAPATKQQIDSISRLTDKHEVGMEMFEQVAAEVNSGTMTFKRAAELITEIQKLPKAKVSA